MVKTSIIIYVYCYAGLRATRETDMEWSIYNNAGEALIQVNIDGRDGEPCICRHGLQHP